MKKITIEIDENYGNVLTFTVVGRIGPVLNVATYAVDIEKTDGIVIDKNGKMVTNRDE